MDPPPPPSPAKFPDLNIVPYTFLTPKLEPKLEPAENGGALPAPDPYLHSPRSLFSPEVHTPLQQLSPAPPDGDELFAEYFRLAQQFLSSYNSKLRPPGGAAAAAGSIVPSGEQSASGSDIVAAAAAKKRKPRSSEMVRVSSLTSRDQIYFRDLVRRTRVTFDSLRLLMIQEETRRAPDAAGLLARRGRPDLKAAALMTDRDLWLNRDRRIIGPIPGINVGDVFFFRMELCVIGLHGQVQAGIDYVPATRSASGEPVATSIIVSGGYEDDDDSGDVLIYTGHGGRDRNHIRQCVNQRLEGGNLALERSMNYGIEIRVIRGIRWDKSPTNKVYVYDGLYKIVEFWLDTGKSGFGVYKYKLVRNEGQEEMGTGLLKLAQDLKANPLIARPRGYMSLDISMGKENMAVSLFNDIDVDHDPLLFEYVVKPLYPREAFESGGWGGSIAGCHCVSGCFADCYCAQMNGGEFAYSPNGLLMRGKPLIYECGPSCRCPPSCANRVSQKGLQNRLEIFRSRETGWGVRSLDVIRAGSFVCEFSGIVLTKRQSELSENGDSLVCPFRFPARWVEWGDISDVFPDYLPPSYPSLLEPSFSLDVSRTRNVACYLSHSYTPNVFLQFVLFDHHNVAYPHLMIYAMENIPPMRELSIDYGVGDEWIGKLTM